ncbi:hypothetical protein M422DRAFT_66219 [Sphaerobolus stellatus SS14]|nr:hypothetical protein M422DRAFT_66219 [Sphaerobolus stellatus SS14]
MRFNCGCNKVHEEYQQCPTCNKAFIRKNVSKLYLDSTRCQAMETVTQSDLYGRNIMALKGFDERFSEIMESESDQERNLYNWLADLSSFINEQPPYEDIPVDSLKPIFRDVAQGVVAVSESNIQVVEYVVIERPDTSLFHFRDSEYTSFADELFDALETVYSHCTDPMALITLGVKRILTVRMEFLQRAADGCNKCFTTGYSGILWSCVVSAIILPLQICKSVWRYKLPLMIGFVTGILFTVTTLLTLLHWNIFHENIVIYKETTFSGIRNNG